MGGILEAIGNLPGAVMNLAQKWQRGDDVQEDAADRRYRGRAISNAAQTADRAPTFRRAESPVARAYLQQFLMGNNQDGISSTRFGGTQDKAAAAKRFDQMTGGWKELQLKERAEADPNRYALKGKRAQFEAPFKPLDYYKL